MDKMIKTLIHLLLALAFSLPFSHAAFASPDDITMDIIDAGSDSVADVMHELEIPDVAKHEANKHEDGKESDDKKVNKEDSQSAREDSEDSREAREDAEDSKNAADEVVSPERPEPEEPEHD